MKRLIFSTIGMIICAFLIYSSAQTLDVYYKNEKAYEDAKINGLSIEQNKKGMYGFVNTKGKFVIKPIFDEVKNFKNDLAQVKYNGKWGFIDLHGNTIIQPIFDEVNDFTNDLSLIKYNDKWGIIDINGNFVITAEYTNKPQLRRYITPSHVTQSLLFEKNNSEHTAIIYCANNKENIIIETEKYIHRNGYDFFITQSMDNSNFAYGITYLINNNGILFKLDAFNYIENTNLTHKTDLIIFKKNNNLGIINLESEKISNIPSEYTGFIQKQSGTIFLGGHTSTTNHSAYGYYNASKNDIVLVKSLGPITETVNNKVTYVEYYNNQNSPTYLILDNSTNDVIFDNVISVKEHIIKQDSLIEITLEDGLKTLIKTDGTIISDPVPSIEIGSNFVIIPNIKIDNLYYNLNIYDKTAEVSRNNNNNNTTTNISIPQKIKYHTEKYTVISIREYAFNDCSSLTSVTIPNSITFIGYNAFNNCTSLASVYISDIKAWCNIKFVSYYSNPLCYAKNLYVNKELVTSLVIPEGVDTIKHSAFANSSITSISIPNSVTSIRGDAFEYCESLTSVYISDIEAWCNINFEYPTSNPLYYAKNLYVNKELVTSLVITEGVDSIKHSAFANSSITSISIPNSVTSIGNAAFADCKRLSSISIPNSVTSIGHSAFAGCSSLSSILIGNNVTSIGSNVFYDTAWENNQPDGVIYINNYLYAYKDEYKMPQNTHINIKEGTTLICSEAFYMCRNLTSITIPNSVTSIGHAAFAGCSTLSSITIPNSVTSIGASAFWGCDELSSIIIPNTVTSIEECTFEGCDKLSSITIPNSVTSIGQYAFQDCSSLKTITIGKSVTTIGKKAFARCNRLTSITIPNSVTSIGYAAFEDCSSLTSVYISNMASWCNTNFIDQSSNPLCYAKKLYLNNELVTSLIIPESVDSIKKYAFYNSSISSISIPNSVTSIKKGAFGGCCSLTSISIPNSVTSIEEGAFRDCISLTSISIPNSVTSIEEGAFWNCFSLTSINVDKNNQHYTSVEGALYTKDMKRLIYRP